MPTQEQVFVAAGKQGDYDNFHYAHAVRAGNLLFVSGQTAAGSDGSMPDGVEAQSRAAFDALTASLASAGLTFTDVVSITSYHVGDVQKDIWEFFRVKDEFVTAPYPAWTAVGVKDLAHAGALIEVSVVASFGAG